MHDERELTVAGEQSVLGALRLADEALATGDPVRVDPGLQGEGAVREGDSLRRHARTVGATTQAEDALVGRLGDGRQRAEVEGEV